MVLLVQSNHILLHNKRHKINKRSHLQVSKLYIPMSTNISVSDNPRKSTPMKLNVNHSKMLFIINNGMFFIVHKQT